MKNHFKKLCLGIGIAGMLFTTSCERSGEAAIFEELDHQNAELVRYRAQPIPGQYVVTLEKGTLGTQPISKGASQYKGAMEQNKSLLTGMFSKASLDGDAITAVYGYTIEGFAASLDDNQLSALSADPRVKRIEQDYLIILAPPPGKGPGGGGGGGGGSPAQETPYGITRVGGGATYSGSNVAYILDTGIDLDHEDLNVNAAIGFNAFTRGKDGKSLDDGNGHGTHVAGTVAAIDNSVGVLGVAAGATVVPVKVLDRNGSGSYSGVIAGVDFVGANGSNGDVANMSLGGPISQSLDDAVVAASLNGIKFSLAAGNESADANNSSPARANGSNIVTISAMDSNDDFAYFSNYANPPVDYCAPGVSIASTWKDGGYNTISGTSMAAPHVCGLMLLGNVNTSGFVNNDPDGNPDPIAHN